jgi:ParB family chromosome partitioning protein
MSKSTKPSARRLRNVTLFNDADEAVPSPNTVPLASIIISATQPRRYFAPEAMQVLVESVKKDGVLQPILVRPVGDKYELVAGERRYRAAQSAGLTVIPAVVREMSDSEAVRFALMENLQREDLNPVEETEGILELLAITLEFPTADVTRLLQRLHKEIKRKKLSHNIMGQPKGESASPELAIIQSVFGSLGRMSWESFTSNRLPLLNLPADILEALRAGRIEYTKAKEIAKFESESERQELLEEAIASSLSLSEIRERVKALNPPAEPPPFAYRMETISKLVKKHQVWDDPKKRKKLETLLAKIEELISPGGLDESQPKQEPEATHNEPPPIAETLPDSSPLESEKDFLESRKDATEQLTAELPPPSEETASVLSERKTPSSELHDESRQDAKEEPTHKGSEATDELLNSSLTHTQMVERLGVKSSTLGSAKKKPNFSEWSKSKDPDAIAWQWVAESKCFVPLER